MPPYSAAGALSPSARSSKPSRVRKSSTPTSAATASAIGRARVAGERGADQRRRERGDRELALDADVEQPGAEPEPDREAAEDERRRLEQRLADAVAGAERLARHERVDRDRVFADRGDESGAREQRQRDGDQGRRRGEQYGVRRRPHDAAPPPAAPPPVAAPAPPACARPGMWRPGVRSSG